MWMFWQLEVSSNNYLGMIHGGQREAIIESSGIGYTSTLLTYSLFLCREFLQIRSVFVIMTRFNELFKSACTALLPKGKPFDWALKIYFCVLLHAKKNRQEGRRFWGNFIYFKTFWFYIKYYCVIEWLFYGTDRNNVEVTYVVFTSKLCC